MDTKTRIRTYLVQPKTTFSVVLQCCDPPVPVFIKGTNDYTTARRWFNALVKDEEEAGGGGEWTLSVWEHRPGSWPLQFLAEDETLADVPFVHSVEFHGSIERLYTNYCSMDWDEKESRYQAEVYEETEPKDCMDWLNSIGVGTSRRKALKQGLRLGFPNRLAA